MSLESINVEQFILILSMKKQKKLIAICAAFLCASLLLSCSGVTELKQPEIVMDIPSAGFQVEVGKQITLLASFLNASNAAVSWELDGTLLSTNKSLIFSPQNVGKYLGNVKIETESGTNSKSFVINVTTTKSPYITNVFEYIYGPGQHASLIPSNAKGESFIGEPWTGSKSFTYLGGWGGYIVAGFDHSVTNAEGADFCIYTQPGAASEPGIVFVMEDKNGDGKPNDTWYEIKGSEYNNSETINNYEVTYFKPQGNGNVKWSDNKGNNGELIPDFESGTWWWSGYGDKSSIKFSGVRLPNSYLNSSTQSGTEYWILRTGLYTSGYAECYNNSDYNSKLKANFLDISNAVGGSGTLANLTKIDFIKVQSGVFQIAGWLNEVSTEISGAADIHLLDKDSY
jgi:hypothetical protein